MSETNLPQVWTPAPFEGSDLLPVALAIPQDRTGREHVSGEDMVLPGLSVLQGMSDAVMQGNIEDARPGRFFHSGAQEVFEPPLRVLICAHTKSRSLFPKEDRVEHAGLEECVSRDAVQGSRYGDCDACPHRLWGPKNESPACSESHNFTVLTSFGPAVIRFTRTSYKAAKNFLTTWTMSPKPLWAHPAIVTVKQQQRRLKSGKDATFYSMEIRWSQREDVPPVAQAAARTIYEQVQAAHESGRFHAEVPVDADE